MEQISDKLSKKEKIMYSLACAGFTLGWIVTFIALFFEPKGEVHESILFVLGQSLVFTAGIFGVGYYFKQGISEMKTEIKNHVDRKIDEKL